MSKGGAASSGRREMSRLALSSHPPRTVSMAPEPSGMERAMYEHRSQPIISHRAFVSRMARHGLYAAMIVIASVVVGMAGYMEIARMSWTDAFLNACMLLGGMGPVGTLPDKPAPKIFAGLFALYAGLAFLVVTALLFAPVFHRLLHRFHLEEGARDVH